MRVSLLACSIAAIGYVAARPNPREDNPEPPAYSPEEPQTTRTDMTATTATDRTATTSTTATDRTATDRTATDRTATDRTATDRTATDRTATDRTATTGTETTQTTAPTYHGPPPTYGAEDTATTGTTRTYPNDEPPATTATSECKPPGRYPEGFPRPPNEHMNYHFWIWIVNYIIEHPATTTSATMTMPNTMTVPNTVETAPTYLTEEAGAYEGGQGGRNGTMEAVPTYGGATLTHTPCPAPTAVPTGFPAPPQGMSWDYWLYLIDYISKNPAATQRDGGPNAGMTTTQTDEGPNTRTTATQTDEEPTTRTTTTQRTETRTSTLPDGGQTAATQTDTMTDNAQTDIMTAMTDATMTDTAPATATDNGAR